MPLTLPEIELLQRVTDLTRRGITPVQKDFSEAQQIIRKLLNGLPENLKDATLEDPPKGACPACGNEETNSRGLWTCECPATKLSADIATPSGGREAEPQENRIEAAYWRFDARRKGYSYWQSAPMSERDAFKAEMRNALAAEETRAEMRLVAKGWCKAALDTLNKIVDTARAPAERLRP